MAGLAGAGGTAAEAMPVVEDGAEAAGADNVVAVAAALLSAASLSHALAAAAGSTLTRCSGMFSSCTPSPALRATAAWMTHRDMGMPLPLDITKLM